MTSALAATALHALRALVDLKGRPTPGQRAAMAAWPGWGVLAPAFNPRPEGSWVEVADSLEELLADRPTWLAEGVNATDTSFYTPDWLVQGMVDALVGAGFSGGKILEPGCGSGRFMAALPDADWTGVEADPVSAALAAAVHPNATILADRLENVTLRQGSFDAAIGNVPFSQHAPFDPEVSAPSLHTYFILRALMAVRPGGYVIVATSRYLLDDARQTDAILELGELRSAVRLASGTFEGTSAVADILVLRRRGGEPVPGAWDEMAGRAGGPTVRSSSYYSSSSVVMDNRLIIQPADLAAHPDARVEVNRYWQVNPGHVAGQMIATGFDRAPLRVKAEDPRTAGLAALATATTDLPPLPAVEPVDPFADLVLADAEGRKEGSYHLVDGDVFQVVEGSLVPKDRPAAELRVLIGLRDLVVDLLATDALHVNNRDADPAADLRARALAAYTAYVQKYGPLNRGTLHEGAEDPETGEPKFSWRRPVMGGFRRDPDYMTVMACESYDPDTQEAEPAPVLLRPVNRAPKPVERVDTAAEAVAVSMGERGRIDLDRIVDLLDLAFDADPMLALGDLAYADPELGGTVVAARDYLSGNVREKLAAARAAAADNPTYERNVAALADVMPADLGPTSIRATLGSPWIAPKYVVEFASDVLGAHPSLTHSAALGLWEIDSTWYGMPEASLAWGTKRKNPYQVLEALLNGRSLTVMDEVWDADSRTSRKVRNADETLAAEEKATAMQERFGTWVWEDKERAQALAAEFNRRFRSHLPRVADGSGLTFPGMSADVELWDWQKDAVDRITSAPRTAIGHPVGSGKTLSMIASAMTLRRLGLANKPMLAVPGHLLEQIAREAMQAYPGGKFLVASKEDLAGDARRLFAARCATGDWDIVIVTHESLAAMPVSPEAESDWLAEEKYQLADAIRSDETRSSRGRTAKAIAGAVKKLDARLSELRHAVADERTVMFEHLGVDWLGVDEVHYFKRLPIVARAEGFSFGSSKRATDLLLKVRVLGQRNPGRPHFAGFTGTLWSNSLAETFVWQKFFQPEALAAAGIDTFDAWAAMFVRYVTAVEVAPDGSGFRLNRRPVEITNVRALMGMFRQVADLMTSDSLPLDRPDTTWHTEVAEMSGEQAAFVTDLAARADALRTGRTSVREDNMLSICNDGRRVALDPNLVGIGGKAGKVELVADRIAKIYARDIDRLYPGSERPGSLQLALCDQGTPGSNGTQTYGRLKTELVARGVPSSAIRFVHEATTDKARAALFAACRDGQVSVLLGSTGKVGVGTNIQTRLAALHHVDVPWRPSDIEQREGRGRRPGNLARVLDIYRYVTEGSFDAYMWQTNETKARFIHALMTADLEADTISDIGASVLSFGEVKALASGNPLLLQHAEAVSDVRRLRTLRAVHVQHVSDLTRQADRLSANSSRATSVAEALAVAGQRVSDWTSRPYFDATAEDVRVAEMMTTRHRPYDRPSATWRGLRVGPVRDERVTSALRTISVDLDYREVGTVQVASKALRRDAVAAVASALGEWLSSINDRRARLTIAARDDRKAESALRTAAASAVFERADDLAAAEARLRTVEREMSAEAEDHQLAA
jgi:N12 class adenine-specific DNA methylase/SAM-dependent methyltransferase